jgi:hypothetical protein
LKVSQNLPSQKWLLANVVHHIIVPMPNYQSHQQITETLKRLIGGSVKYVSFCNNDYTLSKITDMVLIDLKIVFISDFILLNRLITMTEKCQFSKDTADGMTVNDALTVVMYKQSQEEMNPKRLDIKKNGASPTKKGAGSEGEEDEEQPMPVELQWGDGDDAEQQQQQHPAMKVESGEVNVQQQQQQQGQGGVVQLNSFIYASRPPAAAMQQQPRLPTEPSFPAGINNLNAANLSHSDMDLLRRARGGPCICPNCTLFPKRRAGKHNCHIPGCGREYSKTSHLRAHLVSHCNVLPFACSWVGCNKRFYRTGKKFNF